jgi:hypothetical protein
MHSSPGRPARHSWAECLENPANQKKPSAKRPEAYYAHNERRPASNAVSLSDHRTAPASDGYSNEYGDSHSEYSDDEDIFAVTVTPVPCKRAKHEVPPRKELTIAMSESDYGTDNDRALAKLGKLAAKLTAAPSVGKKRRRNKDRKGAQRNPLDLSDSN